jgi:hypothetical protein
MAKEMYEPHSDPARDWFRRHKSVLFLVGLLVISALLLVLGGFLLRSTNEAVKTIGTILMQLGSVGLAASIVTIFFMFRDVRSSFVSSFLQLMFEGGIVDQFSEEAKEKIKEKLVLHDLPLSVTKVEPELYKHLTSVRDSCLSSPIILNYQDNMVLTPHREDSSLLVYSDNISFQFTASHFKNGTAEIPYRFCFAVANPTNQDLESIKSSIRFQGRLGSHEIGRDDLNLEEYMYGSYPMVLCVLTSTLTIRETMDVRFSLQTTSPIFDNTEIVYVRYPCRGFTASLHYLPGYQYDYAWFAQWTHPTSPLPKIGQYQVDQSGITVATNEWILPGEGLALSWYAPTEARSRDGR